MPSLPPRFDADPDYWAEVFDVGSHQVRVAREVMQASWGFDAVEEGNWAKFDPRLEERGGHV